MNLGRCALVLAVDPKGADSPLRRGRLAGDPLAEAVTILGR